MKELIKQYLDNGLSRRQLMAGLSGLGVSAVASKAMAQSLAPYAKATAPATAMREMQGTGGALFVAQLKAAGVEYVFFNPSTGDYPIFDALVDEPGIQLIKGIHEGAVVAMADGYARASGKVGVAIVANVGLPNAMTQMVNAWKDQVPLVVAVASVEQDALGRDQFQESDNYETMTQPITKWYWAAKSTAAIPETLRRGMKFASTPPGGPVFLSLPNNVLREDAKAQIWDQAKFDVPMRIRPDQDDVEKAARLLVEAKNPLMSVGDEITWSRGTKEVVELAELLGLPVAAQFGGLGYSSKPFPTRHPLYVGAQLRDMGALGKPDLLLNMGSRFGERAAPGMTLISIRQDPTSLARSAPVDLGMVADLRLAAIDLVAAIKNLAPAARLKQIADERAARVRAYTTEMWEFRQRIAHERANRTPVSLERIGLELEAALDKDTCYVCDVDSGKNIDPLMSFGGDDKPYFATSPNILGWGMAAAFGVKLA
ncbi:MAG TPA: thiamine pyrophosphate-binding protein, partial [Xanthobacteraceae bacterium]